MLETRYTPVPVAGPARAAPIPSHVKACLQKKNRHQPVHADASASPRVHLVKVLDEPAVHAARAERRGPSETCGAAGAPAASVFARAILEPVEVIPTRRVVWVPGSFSRRRAYDRNLMSSRARKERENR